MTRTRGRDPLGCRARSAAPRRTSRSRSSRVCRRLTASSRRRRPTEHAAGVHAQLVDVGERDQVGAVDPDEARGAHSSSSVVSGTRTRWLTRRRCAAGRSRPAPRRADVASADEPGDAAELDRDPSSRVRLPRRRAVDHPAYRLGEPVGAHRLEHVVDGVQVEGVDRVLVVGGDEDDRRRGRERRQHLGQLEPGQAGHPDVEEDRVDLAPPAASAAPRWPSRR